MSKFLLDDDNDDAMAIATPLLFSEKSRTKKKFFFYINAMGERNTILSAYTSIGTYDSVALTYRMVIIHY